MSDISDNSSSNGSSSDTSKTLEISQGSFLQSCVVFHLVGIDYMGQSTREVFFRSSYVLWGVLAKTCETDLITF